MNTTKISVSVQGIRPLLQNDSFEADAAEGVKKKGQVYDPQVEADKRLITNKEGVLCQKASHFEGAMVKSAVDFKFKGHKTFKDIVKAGVIVDPILIPHNNADWEIDKQSVKIGQARVMRSRPRFDEWDLDFKIMITDDRLEPMVLKEILEGAGYYVGVGDYRPKFGLFEVTKFDVIEPTE